MSHLPQEGLQVLSTRRRLRSWTSVANAAGVAEEEDEALVLHPVLQVEVSSSCDDDYVDDNDDDDYVRDIFSSGAIAFALLSRGKGDLRITITFSTNQYT